MIAEAPSTPSEDSTIDWLLDSGAVVTVTPLRHLFESYRQEERTLTGFVPDRTISSEGSGMITLRQGDASVQIEALHVPEATNSILSMSEMEHLGFFITTHTEGKVVLSDGTTSFNADHWRLKSQVEIPKEEISLEISKIDFWHDRLGHPCQRTLKAMPEHVTGMPRSLEAPTDCTPCIVGKMKATPAKKGKPTTTLTGELLHMDLTTFPCPSLRGHKHALVIVDDASRYVWTFPLMTKAEAHRHIIPLVDRMQTKRVRADNAHELVSGDSEKLLEERGIKIEKSDAGNPKMNSRVETKIRILSDTVRVLLLRAALPDPFWYEV